jgi:16S rRNA (guanine527-N7)-methyltransferase
VQGQPNVSAYVRLVPALQGYRVVQSPIMNHEPPTPESARQESPAAQPMSLLIAGCAELGIALSAEQVAQFERYYEALVEWNAKFNLTAITGYQEVQTKHYLDSLAALPLLAEELQLPLPLARPLHLADVGTGAGFPGVPLKVVAPRLKLTLMDGTGKKIQFLQALIDELKLAGVSFVQGRAEELGRLPTHRGQYDVVTARAVAPLNTLVEYLLPLVRRDGLAVVYKGPSAAEEFVAARKAIEVLGGETVRFAPLAVPYLDEQRFLLLIKKVRPTPNLYPRGQGLSRKKPL